jgi:hypothetical protein
VVGWGYGRSRKHLFFFFLRYEMQDEREREGDIQTSTFSSTWQNSSFGPSRPILASPDPIGWN